MRGGGRPVPAGTRVVVYDIPLVSRNWNTTLLFRENKIFVFSLNNFALLCLALCYYFSLMKNNIKLNFTKQFVYDLAGLVREAGLVPYFMDEIQDEQLRLEERGERWS